MLVCWMAIAVFHMAAIGFASFRLCERINIHVGGHKMISPNDSEDGCCS